MPRNNDPFAAWNDPMHRDDPMAPHNDPMYKDDPLKPWNDVMGSDRDLTPRERKQYGLRGTSREDDDY